MKCRKNIHGWENEKVTRETWHARGTDRRESERGKRQYCGWREIFLYKQIEAEIQIGVSSDCRVLLLSAFCQFMLLELFFFPFLFRFQSRSNGITNKAARNQLVSHMVVVSWCWAFQGTSHHISHVILTCYTSVCPASIIYLVLFVNL